MGQAARSSTRTRPAQDRALERGDGVFGAAHVEPQQRMFEQRQQRDRGKTVQRGFGGEPGKDSGRRFGERVAAGILGGNVPARQRGEHAAPERAVRRHQRGGLAVVHRFAQRHRDGERLFLGIGRFDHGERLERRLHMRFEFRLGGFLPPHVGHGRRPQRLRQQPLAAARRRQARDGIARDADAREQRLHGELRMSGRRRDALALVAGNQLPRLLVEIGIEAGQHHGAVRQPRDGRDQFGGRRDRAGRAGGDHRRVGLARKPRGFRLDQKIAPRDRLDDAAFAQHLRPLFDGDLQEFQRQLPIFVELVRHQIVEALPRHAARRHVVDQPRQIVGERAGRRRRLGDQRRAARAVQFGRGGPLW